MEVLEEVVDTEGTEETAEQVEMAGVKTTRLEVETVALEALVVVVGMAVKGVMVGQAVREGQVNFMVKVETVALAVAVVAAATVNQETAVTGEQADWVVAGLLAHQDPVT